MSIVSYFKKTFFNIVTFFTVLNLLVILIFSYHYSVNRIVSEYEKANRLIDANKSYLSYLYLSGTNIKAAVKTIRGINSELSLIDLREKKSSNFLDLSPIKIDFGGKSLKTLYPRILFELEHYNWLFLVLFLYFLLSFGGMFFYFFRIRKKIEGQIITPLIQLDSYFEKGIDDVDAYPDFKGNKLLEINRSFKNIQSNIKSYISQKNEFNELSKKAAITEMATQVTHDIRSPLAALNSISEQVDKLDTTTKNIINTSISRISQIANNLLEQNKKNNEGQLFNLRLLLDELLDCKKHEFSIKIDRNLDAEFSKSFVNGDENRIYRSLSNLINNACEASVEGECVSISLVRKKCDLVVEIEDNGSGMDSETLKKALNGGYTTKGNGNGIGLRSSREIFHKMGGQLKIESEKGVGTKVIIKLSAAPCPNWFPENLNIEANKIICLSQDASFKNSLKKSFGGKVKDLIFYETEKDFQKLEGREHFFFVDFNLSSDMSGVDFIKKYNLGKRSLLVTDSFHEKYLQSACLEANIKVIPGRLLSQLPFVFGPSSSKKVDVFIDDDKLLHLIWGHEARKNKVKLLTYFNVDEFFEKEVRIPKTARIFIDSNLGKNVKGELEAEKLYKAGYKNLYLATGYSEEDINVPYWIKKVVGKRPEFFAEL